MLRRPVLAVCSLALVVAAVAPTPSVAGDGTAPGPAPSPRPPETRRGDDADPWHGERVPDPYRWLEADDAPEVVAWDRAQQAVTRAVLDAVPQRAAIAARIEAELDLPSPRSLPRFEGGRMWTSERGRGQNHPVLVARDRDGEGPPVVVLDPNTWSADGTAGLQRWAASPDGRWLAYTRDERGNEDGTLFLRDLSAGKDVGLSIDRLKFSGITWAPDSSGFWYTRMPDPSSVPAGEAQLHTRVFFHRLGDLVVDDERVYGAGRPAIESKFVFTTTDDRVVLLGRGEPYRTSDLFALERGPTGPVLRPLFVDVPALSSIDKVGDRFVVQTDWEAPRGRLLWAPVADTPPAAQWKTLLPEGKAVLEGFEVVRDRLVVHLRDDLASHLRVLAADGTDLGEIALPGPGVVRGLATKRDDPRLWVAFESMDRPVSTWVCDTSSPTRALVEVERAPTTVASDRLVTERLAFPSKDGTSIPVFVLRRKDVPLDGRAPTVVTGYGGFRVAQLPRWGGLRAMWAEAGGVLVSACLRGGDEFGEAWHEGGCLACKQNTFDDLVGVVDGLVAAGKASRERLAIEGGSNGGLLVAAVGNQRPDLCRAILCAVPLTDMLRFHRFQFAKIWTKEYGDPDVEAEYRWIRPYSPVHNVKEGAAYPAALVTAGLHDGRVQPFHARKLAAAWQHATTSGRPVLLSIDRDSGHGSASRKQLKAEQVDRFCFLVRELGGPSGFDAPPASTGASAPR